MISKKDKILEHLKHDSITSWEAIQKYRATRLSAIIYLLREEGYDIRSVRETNEETGTNYSRYFLIGAAKKVMTIVPCKPRPTSKLSMFKKFFLGY